jgi:hypothetical protein
MMKKALFFALLVILSLGCIRLPWAPPEEREAEVDIRVSIEVVPSSIRAGSTATLKASIENGWEESLRNVRLYVLPRVEDLDIPDWDGVKRFDTLASKAKRVESWSVGVSERAIPGSSYSLYVRLCFDYESVGYHDLALSPEEKTLAPESSTPVKPISITFDQLTQTYTWPVSTIYFGVKLRNAYIGHPSTSPYTPNDIINSITIEIPDEDELITKVTAFEDCGPRSGGKYTCTISDRELYRGELEIPVNLEFDIAKNLTTDKLTRIVVRSSYAYCVDSSSAALQIIG